MRLSVDGDAIIPRRALDAASSVLMSTNDGRADASWAQQRSMRSAKSAGAWAGRSGRAFFIKICIPTCIGLRPLHGTSPVSTCEVDA